MARAFSTGKFGAGQRLPVTGFVVFGLLTFWVYTVLRFAGALRAHLELRWRELAGSDALKAVDPARLEEARNEGFQLHMLAPGGAAALFGLAGLLVIGWFFRWVVAGEMLDYGVIMLVVGASAALFYLAVALFYLWSLAAVRRHETMELLLHEAGASALGDAAPVPSNEFLARWERRSSEVTLFLVVALPIVGSPALGVHLFFIGWFHATPVILPAACFVLAAVFHVWGTALLVRLFNAHLDAEAAHAGSAPAAAPAATASAARRAGHHDVFVSHSAKDKPVADAICARLESQGVRVWIAPRDILPGSNWGEAIIEALETCRVMVVVFSSAANDSPQVLREVERAVGKGVAVIPFRIENVVPSKAMEYFLSSPHWLDAMQPPLDRHVEELAASIKALLGARPPAR